MSVARRAASFGSPPPSPAAVSGRVYAGLLFDECNSPLNFGARERDAFVKDVVELRGEGVAACLATLRASAAPTRAADLDRVAAYRLAHWDPWLHRAETAVQARAAVAQGFDSVVAALDARLRLDALLRGAAPSPCSSQS